MSIYYKATRPDGTDFHTGTIDYAAALGGDPVTLPVVPRPRCCTSDVLHASTVPTETLIGGSWPCRLFEVTGTPVAEEDHKRGFFALTVVREIDAHQVLGPNGEHVAALIARAGKLTVGETEKLAIARDAAQEAARDAARDAAQEAVRGVALDSAWYAAWDAAWYAAWDAAGSAAGYTALALVARDLISTEHYTTLTKAWAQVIGPAHPDDKESKQ